MGDQLCQIWLFWEDKKFLLERGGTTFEMEGLKKLNLVCGLVFCKNILNRKITFIIKTLIVAYCNLVRPTPVEMLFIVIRAH